MGMTREVNFKNIPVKLINVYFFNRTFVLLYRCAKIHSPIPAPPLHLFQIILELNCSLELILRINSIPQQPIRTLFVPGVRIPLNKRINVQTCQRANVEHSSTHSFRGNLQLSDLNSPCAIYPLTILHSLTSTLPYSFLKRMFFGTFVERIIRSFFVPQDPIFFPSGIPINQCSYVQTCQRANVEHLSLHSFLAELKLSDLNSFCAINPLTILHPPSSTLYYSFLKRMFFGTFVERIIRSFFVPQDPIFFSSRIPINQCSYVQTCQRANVEHLSLHSFLWKSKLSDLNSPQPRPSTPHFQSKINNLQSHNICNN